MRNLSFRRPRYALASLLVAGGLVTGVACVEKKQSPPVQTGLSISPVTKDFGDQAIQGNTAATTFTVKNNGPNTSGTIGVTVEGTDAGNFSAGPDNCSEATLDVGNSCTVDVKFAPQPPPGQKQAELVAVSNLPADGTAKATLRGNATETQPQP